MGKGKPRHSATYVRVTTPYGTSRVMPRDRATRMRDRYPESWGALPMTPATYDEWLDE